MIGGEAIDEKSADANSRNMGSPNGSKSKESAANKKRQRTTAAANIEVTTPQCSRTTAGPSPLAADTGTAPASKKRTRRSPVSTKTLTKESWYRICSLYVNHYSHMSKAAFLRDPASGLEVSGTLSDQQVFGRKLKEFAAGTLQPTGNKRDSDGYYPEVEAKIVEYVKGRLQRHKKEKLGITWAGLCQKAKEFAEVEADPKYKGFSASSGWMQRLMKRNGISNVNSPWVIHTLQSAEEAMDELKSFAQAKGMAEEDVNLIVQFGQKLRQHVVETKDPI